MYDRLAISLVNFLMNVKHFIIRFDWTENLDNQVWICTWLLAHTGMTDLTT